MEPVLDYNLAYTIFIGSIAAYTFYDFIFSICKIISEFICKIISKYFLKSKKTNQ